jgi:uncharacterized OsmC-like protein
MIELNASIRGGAVYTTDMTVRGHAIVADEPLELNGADEGPTPFELLCAALASCTAITLRMYAARKEWPLENVEITVEHEKVEQEIDGKTQRVDAFVQKIRLHGPLDETQKARLLDVAGKCPVHKAIEGTPRMSEVLVG